MRFFNKTSNCIILRVLAGVFFFTFFTTTAQCLEVPALKARVNDYAGVISQATETQLEQALRDLETTDSTQIAILTIPSLRGENLEQFSLKTVEKWQLGTAGSDNGALLLVALKERKVRIEVGYGLEGSLTDLTAGRIIRNDILPRFKQGNFDQGIIDGVNSITLAVRGEYTAKARPATKKREDPFGLFVSLMFFFFFTGGLFKSNKLANAIIGGIGAPLLGILFAGFSLPLIAGLIPVGIVLGLVFSKLHLLSSRSRGSSIGPYISGGFGSSSGGVGGFSGGGGGFGGGGASGGW